MSLQENMQQLSLAWERQRENKNALEKSLVVENKRCAENIQDGVRKRRSTRTHTQKKMSVLSHCGN